MAIDQSRIAAALAILHHYDQQAGAHLNNAGLGPISVPGFATHGGSGGGGGNSWKGLLGNALNILSVPLHAVTSTAKELADGVVMSVDHAQGVDRGHHVSGSDWWKQIVDPKHQINFGAALGEGNKTSDLAGLGAPGYVAAPVGFVGDVALDPLTYVGGVGLARHGPETVAKEIAQSGVKLAEEAATKHAVASLGEEAAAKLSAAEKFGQFGKESDVAAIMDRAKAATASARRTGVSKLSRADIADFLSRDGTKVADRGIGFAGRKIPGTDVGPLGKLGEGFASAKAAASDVVTNTAGRVFQANRDTLLAARSGDPESAFGAVWSKLTKDTASQEAKALRSKYVHDISQITKGIDREKFMAHALPALEGDATSVAALGDAGQKLAALRTSIGEDAQRAGLNINLVEGYAPRLIKDADRAVLQDVGLLKKGAANKFSPLGTHELARTLKPQEDGLYHFAGEKFAASTNAEVTAKVNQIAREKVAAHDPRLAEQFGGFFNANPAEVLSQYVGSISRRIAEAHAAQTLADAGFGGASRVTVADPAVQARLGEVAGLIGQNDQTAVGLAEKADMLGGVGAVTPTVNGPSGPSQAAAGLAVVPGAITLSNLLDAKRQVAQGILGGDTAGAQDAFSQIARIQAERAGGTATPAAIERAVADHFPTNPNGDPFADTAAIRKTTDRVEKQVRRQVADQTAALNTTNRLTDAVDGTKTVVSKKARKQAAAKVVTEQLAGADQYIKQNVEQLTAKIGHDQQLADHTTELLAQPGLTKDARTNLVEMRSALSDSIKWSKVQARQLNVPNDPIARVAAYERIAADARASLADLHNETVALHSEHALLANKTIEQVTQAIKDGVQIEIKHGVGTPADVADMLLHVERLATPEGLRTSVQQFDHVVAWLKSWQIATPGFHVRNALGGVYNNLLAGVSTSSYPEFFNAVRKAAKGTLDDASTERLRIVEQSIGHGQIGTEGVISSDHLAQIAGQTKTRLLRPSRNNFWVRGSQHAGEWVELHLRGALAWDTLKKGGTVHDAVAAVNKFHFDYADLSKAEQAIKHVIPFYTWTRKNLPLQVEQIIKNPRYYSAIYHAKAETEQLSTPDAHVQTWFGDLMAIRLPWQKGGGHVYATPDLPPRDLTRISDPFREVAGMVTPLIKTPAELWAGKQVFKDLPLSDKKFVPVPLPALLVKGVGPALKLLGVAHEQDGKLFVTEKNAYALEQAVPIIARYRRTFPSEAKFEAKRMTTILSFIGLGTRTNSQAEQDAYNKTLQFQQKDAATKQKALAKAANG